MVQLDPDSLPLIHQTYIDQALNATLKQIKRLLADLLTSIARCRILIDGIDEIEESHQKEVISTILALQKGAPNTCKLFISSRNDEGLIKNLLKQVVTVLPLKYQTGDAIRAYINVKVQGLSEIFGSLDNDMLELIQTKLSSRAEGKENDQVEMPDLISLGMFLYVRLVVDELSSQTNVQELEEALERLPLGLNEA